MLKWLVQRIPDPAAGGDDTRPGQARGPHTTDDPLATLNLGNEPASRGGGRMGSTSAWSFGKGKGASVGSQEIYSVNRYYIRLYTMK